ncbi:MAG: xanthine dehydrogenase accessory protein XdhC [Planctomycetales bacterium]|nr:xanthine dehydrogenase accessory protein XdhC [Planctomycetales bacterium]
MSYDIVEHTHTVQKLLDGGAGFVIVTLVEVRGSAPQVTGAKAIVTDAGIVSGTVGGGKIEAASIAYAQQLLSSGPSRCELKTWNLQTEIGMTCGGEVRLLFESRVTDSWPIAVFGAGHVAQALLRALLPLHCQLTCIDPRQEWLAKLPESPKLRSVCTDRPVDEVGRLPEHTFFVLMSQGHATDLPVLAELLRSGPKAFIGVIGSRQKATALKRDLKSQGFSSEQLEAFQCPVGLSLGNNTPAEIAISIAAQLLQHRDQHAANV